MSRTVLVCRQPRVPLISKLGYHKQTRLLLIRVSCVHIHTKRNSILSQVCDKPRTTAPLTLTVYFGLQHRWKFLQLSAFPQREASPKMGGGVDYVGDIDINRSQLSQHASALKHGQAFFYYVGYPCLWLPAEKFIFP